MTISNDKRDRILSAALTVFAAKGFYNTKVSEIAQKAKVADGTIYNYFKSKDDLLICLFEDRMELILTRLNEELKGDVFEQITRFIELHLSLVQIEPSLAEFITLELRQSDKFLREYNNPKFANYLRILSSLIEKGQKEGLIRPRLNSKVIARAMFGSLDEILLSLTLTQKSRHIDVKGAVKQLTDLYLFGLKAPQS